MQICSQNPVRSVLLVFAVLAALGARRLRQRRQLRHRRGTRSGQRRARRHRPLLRGRGPARGRTEGRAALRALEAAQHRRPRRDDPLGDRVRHRGRGLHLRRGCRALARSDAPAPSSAALSGSDGDGAVALAVTDEGRGERRDSEGGRRRRRSPRATRPTRASATRSTRTGAAVGIVGDFLVAGTEEGLKAAIDASSADSLADNSDAMAALDSAPSDSLFRTYIDPTTLIDLARRGRRGQRRRTSTPRATSSTRSTRPPWSSPARRPPTRCRSSSPAAASASRGGHRDRLDAAR